MVQFSRLVGMLGRSMLLKEFVMRSTHIDTHYVLVEMIRVYRWARSKRWQSSFVIDWNTVRLSGCIRDLIKAKTVARDASLQYKFYKNMETLAVSKKFPFFAQLAISGIGEQLSASLRKKIYTDYIVCIERSLVAYSGAHYVSSLDFKNLSVL